MLQCMIPPHLVHWQAALNHIPPTDSHSSPPSRTKDPCNPLPEADTPPPTSPIQFVVNN